MLSKRKGLFVTYSRLFSLSYKTTIPRFSNFFNLVYLRPLFLVECFYGCKSWDRDRFFVLIMLSRLSRSLLRSSTWKLPAIQ